MKRPSEYMTMTDGVTQHDYKQALNKYIDYLEAENKQLILSGVSDIVHRAELKVLENVSDYIPCEIYSQAVIFSQKKRDNVR
jgi:hypothetical protein